MTNKVILTGNNAVFGVLEAYELLKKYVSEESAKHFRRMQVEGTTDEQMRFSSGFLSCTAYVLHLIQLGMKNAEFAGELYFFEEPEEKNENITVKASVE